MLSAVLYSTADNRIYMVDSKIGVDDNIFVMMRKIRTTQYDFRGEKL